MLRDVAAITIFELCSNQTSARQYLYTPLYPSAVKYEVPAESRPNTFRAQQGTARIALSQQCEMECLAVTSRLGCLGVPGKYIK